MAIGGRHVAVVALVTLLLTYAAFQGKSSSPSGHGESVAVAGRKGLAEPQEEVAPAVLAEESAAFSQDSLEEQTSEESTDQTSEESTDQTSDEQTSDEQTSEESDEQTSEESDEQTSEEQTEETSTEQAFNQDFQEEVISEEVLVEVSDEPITEEVEPSTDESTPEETSSEEFATEESSEESTAVEESWNSEDVQAQQENVEFSTNASEETSFERTQVREMEEVMAPQSAPPTDNAAAAGPSTIIENPDASNYPKPKDNPNVFLREIAEDNAMARQNERYIWSCIQDDGCGTP